jgi:hypothetical protein
MLAMNRILQVLQARKAPPTIQNPSSFAAAHMRYPATASKASALVMVCSTADSVDALWLVVLRHLDADETACGFHWCCCHVDGNLCCCFACHHNFMVLILQQHQLRLRHAEHKTSPNSVRRTHPFSFVTCTARAPNRPATTPKAER